MSLPRGKLPGLLAHWSSASAIFTLTLEDNAFFFDANVRDVLGLDCELSSGAFLTLRAFLDVTDDFEIDAHSPVQ